MIDWISVRATATAYAQGAQVSSDTYVAIRYALGRLNDRHSYLMDPGWEVRANNNTGNPDPRGQVLFGFGYVWMPGLSGVDEARVTAQADRLQGIIREVDNRVPCGWIVDLRNGTGGNMWPMLAGIGPVLGEGIVGAFVDFERTLSEWYYQNGSASVTGSVRVLATVSGIPYRLRNDSGPVAVLTGPITASSSETVAIAFRGRPRSCGFGTGTNGVSTDIRGFALSDGALLGIATSFMADGTGRVLLWRSRAGRVCCLGARARSRRSEGGRLVENGV